MQIPLGIFNILFLLFIHWPTKCMAPNQFRISFDRFKLIFSFLVTFCHRTKNFQYQNTLPVRCLSAIWCGHVQFFMGHSVAFAFTFKDLNVTIDGVIISVRLVPFLLLFHSYNDSLQIHITVKKCFMFLFFERISKPNSNSIWTTHSIRISMHWPYAENELRGVTHKMVNKGIEEMGAMSRFLFLFFLYLFFDVVTVDCSKPKSDSIPLHYIRVKDIKHIIILRLRLPLLRCGYWIHILHTKFSVSPENKNCERIHEWSHVIQESVFFNAWHDMTTKSKREYFC